MKISQAIILIIIILLGILVSVSLVLADLLWFSGLGYADIYLTMVLTSLWFGLLLGVIFLAFAMLNLQIAKRLFLNKSERKGPEKAFFVLAAILAIALGFAFTNWELLLKFLNPSIFGSVDPVFGLDIGFYVFTLPFYQLLFSYMISALVLTTVLVLFYYLSHVAVMKKSSAEEDVLEASNNMRLLFNFSKIKKTITPHLSLLLALIFFVAAFGFYLAPYGLLFGSGDVFYGAGFTDLNVTLLFLNVGFFISIAIGVIFLFNLRIKRWKLPMEGIAALAIIMFIGFLAAGVVQIFQVGPDEYNIEKSYMGYNINSTLAAYGLDAIDNMMFPVSYDLDMADINQNSGTIGNIRLWDWRPLLDTFTQLQLFRTYYDFSDVDIDRYTLNGDYKQVMVSPRELDINDLSSNARTWVNEHLVYTHGYGVVMTPVDRISSEGLPEFYIQDIPPKTNYDSLEIDRPQIYFGEEISQYVITDTNTQEFDYPSGNQNIYTSYEGTGGVQLSNLLTKLVYAIKFGSIELLFSGSVTSDSKILLHRNVAERASLIAPFLSYDYDPYIVVDGGRLYWIIDAYTMTDSYPYSEPVYSSQFGVFNYIRNPVKVVIDAYNGDVSYYVIDSSEPIIQTYMKMFPGLFKDFSEMPEGLRGHIRYPENLFSVQAVIYSTYHMKDTQVFYNKEDVWVVPNEVYRGNMQPMQPYYVIIKLTDAQDEDFMLMIPFKPVGSDKQNMIGWMSANCDPENYGEITVYQFSKQELVYGPMQFEARVDQDTEISQLITLWSQSGSSVIRGNTLIIPIENSILYVEPLYLQATQEGSLPQLKRVIVAYDDKLTMQETLGEALAVIFEGEVTPPTPSPGNGTAEQTLAQISELYEQAQAALQAGDFAGYAQYIEEIGALLEQL